MRYLFGVIICAWNWYCGVNELSIFILFFAPREDEDLQLLTEAVFLLYRQRPYPPSSFYAFAFFSLAFSLRVEVGSRDVDDTRAMWATRE